MTPEDLAGLIGEDETLALLARRAGQRLYVPRRPSPALIATCGKNGAEALVAAMGGSFLLLPVAKRWRAIAMRRRGVTVRDIALTLGLGERAVWYAISEAGLQHEQSRTEVA